MNDLKHFGRTKLAQDISTQHNLHKSESEQVEISAEKYEQTLLYLALIKKKKFKC